MAFEVFDDNAFSWFLQTLLGLILVPPTFWWVAKPVFRKALGFCCKVVDEEEDVCCECRLCAENRVQFKEAQKRAKITRLYLIKWTVFIGLWILFLMIVLQNFEADREFVSFDPYEILELDVGAEEDVIKKAYRSMSLIWHPDKNLDNPDAEQRFVMIAKAYKTLTDDATRENYEKYGNPDGYQGTSVTIGLPSFLTRKENERVILVVYAIVMIILVISVSVWWKKSSKFHKSGVLNESVQMFNAPNVPCKVTTTSEPDDFLAMLSLSAEFRPLNENGDTPEFARFYESMKKEPIRSLGSAYQKSHVYVKKAYALLAAHLVQKSTKRFDRDQKFVLKNVHRLLDCLFEEVATIRFWFQRKWFEANQQQKKVKKKSEPKPWQQIYAETRVPLRPACHVIHLAQYATQGMWVGDSELLQLPHFGPDELKACKKAKVDKILKFKRMTPTEREDVLKTSKTFKPEIMEDINRVCEVLPDVEVKYFVETEGEAEIMQGDFVSVTIRLERIERREKTKKRKKKTDRMIQEKLAQSEQKSGADSPTAESGEDDDLPTIGQKKKKTTDSSGAHQVHAPCFPFPKYERWIVILFDRSNNSVVSFHRVPSLKKVEDIELKLKLGDRGKCNYDVHALCDSYIGLDQTLHFDFKPGKVSENKDENAAEDSEIEDSDDEEEETGPWYSTMEWYDYLTLVFFAFFLYVVIPNTTLGRRFVMPVVDKAMEFSQTYIYDFGRINPEHMKEEKGRRGSRFPGIDE